jgi:hypothetical protein
MYGPPLLFLFRTQTTCSQMEALIDRQLLAKGFSREQASDAATSAPPRQRSLWAVAEPESHALVAAE